jgi:hypothetical protein
MAEAGDVDPDVSLRTLRAAIGSEGRALHDDRRRLRLIEDVFAVLDRYMREGGDPPKDWR